MSTLYLLISLFFALGLFLQSCNHSTAVLSSKSHLTALLLVCKSFNAACSLALSDVMGLASSPKPGPMGGPHAAQGLDLVSSKPEAIGLSPPGPYFIQFIFYY
ncbi:hypothetical protein SCHPADRAFT_948230 [Schizopora paradoxa]|uniref:Uncharacterized protein n=1 Tax=Schizopora paradoxa TaxID=27342 RepID=A0A0H2QWB1_9AGAM|nr:hypothetical protein SCHPADRAFT_948230 [Schizopora paradoxa]